MDTIESMYFYRAVSGSQGLAIVNKTTKPLMALSLQVLRFFWELGQKRDIFWHSELSGIRK
jgi:hypothetical protein